MNKQAPEPEEDLNDLLSDLAMTMADILDHSQTPYGLRDVLTETIDELTNAVGPSCSESLRALAGLAKSRHTAVCPKPLSAPINESDANLTVKNEDSYALTVGSAIH